MNQIFTLSIEIILEHCERNISILYNNYLVITLIQSTLKTIKSYWKFLFMNGNYFLLKLRKL